MNYLPTLRKELFELWRTSRWLVTGVVVLAFGMASPVLAKFTPELIKAIPEAEQFAAMIPPPTINDAIIQYVKNMSQFGVLLALLMTMGAVAQEKERGTAAMMLVKPVSRGAFLLAKFSAISLMLLSCLLLAGIAAYYYTLLLFGALDVGGWVLLNLLTWLALVVLVAITLLCSTLVRSQAAAAGMAFGALLLSMIVGAIPPLAKYMPARLIEWGTARLVGAPLEGWLALGVSLGLIAASLLAAWMVFRKQEL